LHFLFETGLRKKRPKMKREPPALTTVDLPQIAADVLKPMDGGIELCSQEVMGCNAWNLWSGGNQHFWNQVAQIASG